MKKLWLILIAAALVIITIFVLFQIWDSGDGGGIIGGSKTASYTEFLQAAKPSVLQYCASLNNVAGYASNEDKRCPTCFPMISANYDNYYTQFPEAYAVVKNGANYTLNIEVKTIYGLRNDMPGTASLTFVMSKDGNISEKNIPSTPCI